ncbi:MAG TPA: secondary thiamine-phosphate synthase enzyme YjbQ [Actinomycetota bacterium]|jgi:secondary thiamine-phosphate synthase enzyme|nr:secondary thiamine-phosphate synthase enzyme YjbQ [Actinomycetota bacterium]
MRTERLTVDTSGRRVVDVTEMVLGFADGISDDGLLSVFVPHATAGLVLMETGAGSEADLVEVIERLLPRDDRYRHRHGSEGHGGDHLLPAFVSSSLVLPVIDGQVVLGTWQRVVIVDTNRENNARSVILSFLSG